MKTNKMKKILIALDYNPTAQKVAETGFALAKTMKAEVVLLHVVVDIDYYIATEHYSVMGFAGFRDSIPAELQNTKELIKATKRFLDKTKKHLGGKNITTLVKEGDLAETILKTADTQKADLIVMGSHSRKWLENIIMGRVTEKVLHKTRIPVFIIPTKKQD